MDTLATRLRSERIRLKLSQRELGNIGGVATNAQGKYESGERSPRADYLEKIFLVGVDVYFVLTGERGPLFLPEVKNTPEVVTLLQKDLASITKAVGNVVRRISLLERDSTSVIQAVE
uniref:helix-turn-helix domain-containing protein n=1 Tax=Pseudomonas sp. TaxID=306 RepID=UPI0010B0F1CF|nr:helix-turn-helix transcriptional regulator [Pseudomonas sp.]QBM91751.1 XRE family transcriptional regulator, HtH motif [Pseudomonas sp.]QBM91826.1 transcriptional regulator, XRE family [Pseudomonas sp.]